jgi:hypothetical protein
MRRRGPHLQSINSEAVTEWTRDGLRRAFPFQLRSLPCIGQQSLVPREPYQSVNPDEARNGWRIAEDFLPLAGKDRSSGEPMDQERRPG